MSLNTAKTPMMEFAGCKLDEIPEANPPREYKDLQEYNYGPPDGQKLFEVPDMVLENPDLLGLWEALVIEAQKNPLVVVDGGMIRRVVDGAEIDRQIAWLRSKYDEERDKFHLIMNGDYPSTPHHYSVNFYLKREGIAWDQAWVDEVYPEGE